MMATIPSEQMEMETTDDPSTSAAQQFGTEKTNDPSTSTPQNSETKEVIDLSHIVDKFVPRCTTVETSDSESSSSEDDSSDSDSDSVVSCSSETKTHEFQRLKTDGELLLEDLPPLENLEISVPEDKCDLIGHIFNTVETLVLVKATPGLAPVDIESVLFLDKGDCVLGEVFDVIGPVSEPIYCVRFNSKEYINELSFNVGDPVYYAPTLEYTNFVFLPDLLRMKGSDASWKNGNEPPPDHVDYSDDEQERAAKRKRRSKRKWDSRNGNDHSHPSASNN